MIDNDKPKVVELKGVSKEPVDENTKHLLETLGAVTQMVRDGSIQQICFTMIDAEGDLSVTVGGVSANPYKMAYSLQNDVSYIYLTMVGGEGDE